MQLSLNVSVPMLTVFLQGILSFFSPCVLPLIPLYISYLSGGTIAETENGTVVYQQRKVIAHTLCFVLGVSFAFFALGLGFSALGSFFKGNQALFAKIGGILVFCFGLYQLGIFGTSKILGNEHRLRFSPRGAAMSPLTALVMGFTFSFAWTPCVGPALASVLLMTASANTTAVGFALIGVYTLGFVLPFLAVGLFTTKLLELFKTHRNIVRYTVKIGGVLMMVMGVMMYTGKMNAVTGYLSELTREQPQSVESEPASAGEKPETVPETVSETTPETGRDPENSATVQEETEAVKLPPAVDFTLTDQFGNTHTLSDYLGKTVFLNFWATWCPPCRAEMPDIQKLYETYPQEGEDALIVLGVASPGLGGETSEEGIKAFMEENGYTYPVLMDTTGEQFMNYGITSYPTTFMIDRDGNVYGYVPGQLTWEMMESIIRQTMEGSR